MNFALYHAAVAADNAWQKALESAFGKRAGDARYDHRGTSTPELLALAQAKLAADRAWREVSAK